MFCKPDDGMEWALGEQPFVLCPPAVDGQRQEDTCLDKKVKDIFVCVCVYVKPDAHFANIVH